MRVWIKSILCGLFWVIVILGAAYFKSGIRMSDVILSLFFFAIATGAMKTYLAGEDAY